VRGAQTPAFRGSILNDDLLSAADVACERDANISPSTRGHARVIFPRQILPTCGAFVSARTGSCPRFPAWFQDGKEGFESFAASTLALSRWRTDWRTRPKIPAN